MQVKDKTPIKRKKSVALRVVKGAVSIGCLYYIYIQIKENRIDFSAFDWPQNSILIVFVVFFLMPLNWYLEVLRWKISLNSFEKIFVFESWKSVLSGLALNWVLPFTSGDFTARIISRKDKYQSISAIILNRMIMLLLTLLLGAYSLLFLPLDELSLNWLVVGIMLIGMGASFYFRNKIRPFLAYFKTMELAVASKVLVLSILRYVLFVYQFFLLLDLFNPTLEYSVIIAGIGWVFLMRSVIPHFLGGIGLRESAGIVFFSAYTSSVFLIVIPVTLIWIINTVIPSLVGILLIWRHPPNNIDTEN